MFRLKDPVDLYKKSTQFGHSKSTVETEAWFIYDKITFFCGNCCNKAIFEHYFMCKLQLQFHLKSESNNDRCLVNYNCSSTHSLSNNYYTIPKGLPTSV